MWVETSEGADGQMVMGRESGGGGLGVFEGHQTRLYCDTKEAPRRRSVMGKAKVMRMGLRRVGFARRGLYFPFHFLLYFVLFPLSLYFFPF